MPRPLTSFLFGTNARVLAGLACVALISCTPRPDLSNRASTLGASPEWPSLLPLSQLDVDAAQTASLTDETVGDFGARANALRARANRLSNAPVLNSSERQALLAALNRNAARN